MRQYAWYAPAINCIVLQTIMDDCYICFEWGNEDMYEVMQEFEIDGSTSDDEDLMEMFLWIPIGEL